MRIACLLVPEFLLAAELRAHPKLVGYPFAISTTTGPHAKIMTASPEAHRFGVLPPITVTQAHIACSSLYVRPFSPTLVRTARNALLDVALSISPRAELETPKAGCRATEAAVYIDASGCHTLFRSEAGFSTALVERTARLGLPSVVAIAGSREVAHIAARELTRNESGTIITIPPGKDATFLAPLPLDLLDLDHKLIARLARFGLRRIGELAHLPRHAAATRLGQNAAPLLRLARGEMEDVLPVVPRNNNFEETIDLEVAVDRIEPLSFVLKKLLTRLCERLSCRHLACGNLDATFLLEGHQYDTHRVSVDSATLDVNILLRLILLPLSARPLTSPVEGITLTTTGCTLRSDQPDFFRPAGPTPLALSLTINGLKTSFGQDRIGAPVLEDSHRPDAYALQPFCVTTRIGIEEDIHAPSVRALRPPVQAYVTSPHGPPEHIRSTLVNGKVRNYAGPWKNSGAWWSKEEHFIFDYYDIATDDGFIFRLRLDRLRNRWEIDALYD